MKEQKKQVRGSYDKRKLRWSRWWCSRNPYFSPSWFWKPCFI